MLRTKADHEVTAEDLGRSWRPGCPVPVSRLRDLAVAYWSYAGTRRMGHVIVHQDAVTDVRMERI